MAGRGNAAGSRIEIVTCPRPLDVATWIGLAILSLALGWLLTAAAISAAVLIGPMLVAIGFGLAGSTVRVSRPLFTTAQGVVGCLIAGAVTPDVLAEVVRDWDAMLFGVLVTMVASAAIGLLLARFGTLPGSTAAWGTAPGAASAMVLLAQEYGSDPRLVATMQYVRVITVVLAASLISRMLIAAPVAQVPVAVEAGFDPAGLALTALIAFAGAWIGRWLRIPAGALIVPLAVAAILNATGYARLSIPPWLLAGAYAVIGWAIGLQFERGSLIRSIRALPEMIGAALAIVALCGLAAYAMVRFMGIGALTAFLATSPGGIDTVAIIALSGGADTPFVMSLQALRLLTVIAMGPAIARFVARYAKPD